MGNGPDDAHGSTASGTSGPAARRPQNAAVVVATYDERANVERLLPALLGSAERLQVVVVDDASPDGTAEAVETLAPRWRGRVHLIRRSGKLGYGSAFVAGFRRALDLDVDAILSMDADFSHDPAAVPQLLAGLSDHDVVVGSRFLGGVRILNWSLWRLLLSVFANRYVGTLLRLGVRDCTSGFRAYRTHVLRTIDVGSADANGYAFLVEILHLVRLAGFRVKEVPIVYEDRQRGESKMDRWVILEAVWKPWQLLLRSHRGRARG